MISEERLREIVRRVLTELEAEEKPEKKQRKIYMLCTHSWDDRFHAYLKQMEKESDCLVYPVIPLSWKNKGYEASLLAGTSCGGIIYRSCENPADLNQTVTVLPVVPRDVVVKTALCIADTFETKWIASCMEIGSQVAFMKNGLIRFSGKEPAAYVNQILSYYRTVLTYGIEICGEAAAIPVKTEYTAFIPAVAVKVRGKKRVITASNVNQFASDGVLCIGSGDVVTDLARDRAKFLNIVLKEQDCEVKG